MVLGYVPLVFLLMAEVDHRLTEYLAVNFSIFMMLAGLALAVKVIHRRPLLTLVTPAAGLDWRRIGQAALMWCVIAAAISAIEHALYPDRYYLSFDAGRFLPFLAFVLVLTPIQTTVEELVFRGYALQGFGLLMRRPTLVAIASTLVFTFPHLLNPEVEKHGVALMAANYFAIGMLLVFSLDSTGVSTTTKNSLSPAAKILIRVDMAGATHGLLEHPEAPNTTRRTVRYTVGWKITEDDEKAIAKLPESVWAVRHRGLGRRRAGDHTLPPLPPACPPSRTRPTPMAAAERPCRTTSPISPARFAPICGERPGPRSATIRSAPSPIRSVCSTTTSTPSFLMVRALFGPGKAFMWLMTW